MASALVGALTTGNAVALGLGDIEAKSALNQPFNAEVTLLSATEEELNELKVELASNDAFSRAGIDRNLFLSRLQFEVSRNGGGQPVIRVTSREAVTEPFLDFLIEVSWSKGRLLREYTVLIDPPVTMPAAPVAMQAPSVSAAPVASAPSSRPMQAAPARSGSGSGPTAGAGEYGPTQRNDTLWRIAEQVRPDAGVSIEQTMLAILRANPEAFIDNNINNLKAGQVLRIPERDEMTQTSQAEARRESRAQYDAWQAARHGVGVASADGASDSLAGDAGDKPSLQLLAPDSAEAMAAVGGAADAAEVDGLKRELVLANEALEAQRLEAEDANSRLLVLEEQIQNMRRLIDLKDSELARLQSIVGQVPEAMPAEGDAMSGEPETSAATGEAMAPEVATGTELAPVEGEVPAEDMTVAGAAAPADTAEPQAPDLEAVAPPSEPAVSEPAADGGAADEPAQDSFVKTLLAKLTGNPVWLGVGGALLLLLAMFGLRRKQAADDSEFQESILRTPNDEDQLDESVSGFGQSSAEVARGSNSSLLSEFAVSDMTSAEGDGATDPLAEADVYLAYGRYQQAADLVKEALETDPDREELHLKLLEIYQAAGQDEAFDSHAQALLERLGDSEHSLWKRVSEMGVAVNPRNPIYTLGAATGAAADDSAWSEPTTQSYQGMESDDAEPDLARMLETFEAPAPAAAAESPMADNGLEFDLDGFDLGDDEGEDVHAGDGELADMDEVSTKLDLARAYIDMGDSDGARSILDEVIEEGNEEQKNEAHDILQRLAS